MGRTASACLSALVLLAGASAEAQDEPRVYIVSVPMNPSVDAVATRTGSAARAALRTVQGVDWRGPDQQFLGYEESTLATLTRARERFDAGRQAYLNLELEQAIAQLRGAVADFDHAAAALEDPNDLGTALLFLGASHAFNNQRRQALAVFRRLHTQMPHIQPDPNTFNPDVVQLYQSAAPPDARAPSATISIASDPPGAVVYVDFLARGRTPIDVPRLVGGDHVVRVSRPGAAPFVQRVGVRRGATVRSTASLSDRQGLEGLNEIVGRIAQADVSQVRGDSPIAQVAQMLDVSKIGVIRVSPAGEGQASLELLLFDVGSGRRLVRGQGTVPTGVGQLEQGVQRLVAGAFERALHAPPDAPTAEARPHNHRPMVVAEPPITEQWWFWTIIGGAAVVVIAAIAIGVVLGTQSPSLGNDRSGQVIFTF